MSVHTTLAKREAAKKVEVKRVETKTNRRTRSSAEGSSAPESNTIRTRCASVEKSDSSVTGKGKSPATTRKNSSSAKKQTRKGRSSR